MPKKTPKAEPAPRVRRSPEESRARILEAAIRVISHHGPEAAGLKQVAHEAGVSHALVAHYFGTYDELVNAAMRECAARLRKRLIDRLATSTRLTPDGAVQLYLEAVMEPWYGRLVSWALIADPGGEKNRAAQLAPDLKLIAEATHVLLQRHRPEQTRAQSEAAIVGMWSLAIGYVVGNQFFWRSLGRAPGPKRDRELRDAVTALTRMVFGDHAS